MSIQLHKIPNLSQYVLTGICLLETILIHNWVFHESYNSFDFTDEAFCLIIGENPSEYLMAAGRSGHILYPLLWITNNNIPLIRIITFFVISLSVLLNFIAFGKASKTPLNTISDYLCAYSLASAIATFSWISRYHTSRTLDYNIQNAIILLLLNSSILFCIAKYKRDGKQSAVSFPHISVGICFFFLCIIKITSAMLFLILSAPIIIYLNLFQNKTHVYNTLIGIIVPVLIYLIFFETPSEIIQDIRNLFNSTSTYKSSHGPGDLISISFQDALGNYIHVLHYIGERFILLLIITIVITLLLKQKKLTDYSIIPVIIFLPLGAMFGNLKSTVVSFTLFFSCTYIIAFCFTTGSLVHQYIIYKRNAFTYWKRKEWIWCVFMIAFCPIIYSFGSNVPFDERATGSSSIYICLSSFLFIYGIHKVQSRWKIVTTTILSLFTYFLYPLWSNPHEICKLDILNRTGDTLTLPHQESLSLQNLEKLIRKAENHGFSSRTQVVDFWGYYPGINYLLGGKPPRWPWFTPYYPGSTQFAQWHLQSLPECQLKSIWILEATAPPPFNRHLPINEMPYPFSNFPCGYKEIGSINFHISSKLPPAIVRLWCPTFQIVESHNKILSN